jgi:hypothetical protein
LFARGPPLSRHWCGTDPLAVGGEDPMEFLRRSRMKRNEQNDV